MSKLTKFLSKKTLAFGASMFLLGGAVIPTVAESWLQDIQVRMGVNLQLNGQTVVPHDASGKDMPVMLYQSTTYVPVRYISEYYGKEVGWDPNTTTVSISDKQTAQPTTPQPLYLTTLQPKASGDAFGFTNNGYQSTAGTMCTYGIRFFNQGGQIEYYLDGKFSKLGFDVAYNKGIGTINTQTQLIITGHTANGDKTLFNKAFDDVEVLLADDRKENHYDIDTSGVEYISFKAQTLNGLQPLMLYNIVAS